MQPSQDVENAISDLIQAKEKIKHLESTNKYWQDCYAKSNKQRNEAEAEIFELERERDAFKEDNIYLRSCNAALELQNATQKDNIKALNNMVSSRSTEERDSILSEIRKVLGAQDRSDGKPHETALNAAKRVMEEAKLNKEILKDLKKFKSNTLYCLQIDQNTETDKAISELKRQLIKFSYKESYDKLFNEFGRLQELVLGKGSVTETYEDLYKPIESLVKVSELSRKASGILPEAPISTLIGHLEAIEAKHKFSSKQFGRTYSPPAGMCLVEQKYYDDLVKSAYSKFPLDKKALKALQDKVNEVHNIIDKINND